MILAILQARVSSTRLPGKVLELIDGQPMIVRQIERVTKSRLIEDLVVATSVEHSDDPLVSELERRGVSVRRGPLDDVVERFNGIIREFSPQTIVRLTADCPLADPEVIDLVIAAHLGGGRDYTSNTLEPTFPDGLDVEVITQAAWSRLVALPISAQEREHVTLGIYGRPAEFTLSSVTQSTNRGGLRWTVDVAEDLEFVRQVYRNLHRANPAFGQDEILALIAAQPHLNRTDADLARNGVLNARMEVSPDDNK